MKTELSLHAQIQMSKRDISEADVLLAIEEPFNIVEEDGLKVYQKIILGGAKPYLLRVYVETTTTPPIVVTVYKTSKLVKYL